MYWKIVFLNKFTKWNGKNGKIVFSKPIASHLNFNGGSLCLADSDLIKILQILQILQILVFVVEIFSGKRMFCSLGHSSKFPKSTKLCHPLPSLIQFNCFVLSTSYYAFKFMFFTGKVFEIFCPWSLFKDFLNDLNYVLWDIQARNISLYLSP